MIIDKLTRLPFSNFNVFVWLIEIVCYEWTFRIALDVLLGQIVITFVDLQVIASIVVKYLNILIRFREDFLVGLHLALKLLIAIDDQ